MATYKATVMHGVRGGEGEYTFETEDGIIQRSGMTTLRALMAHIETRFEPGEFEWHVGSVHRNKEKGIVTAMGEFVFHGSDIQPFICYITKA